MRKIFPRFLHTIEHGVAKTIDNDETQKNTLTKNYVYPGDLLSIVIKKITGVAPCGLCHERAKIMNKRGWKWCYTHIPTIVGWLVEAAKERGHDVDSNTVRSLLKASFKELKKQSLSKDHELKSLRL